MRKGISPIVAVVLLIAIAVIAAVGLYFWVTTFTSSPSSGAKPYVIGAVCTGAGKNTNGTLFITNPQDTAITLSASNTLHVTTSSGADYSTTSGTIPANGNLQISASTLGASLTSGTTGVAWLTQSNPQPFTCAEQV